ncbi:hypothetical protein [Nocardioides sp. LHG3406-4]|uniref:hypothetical protein n=1 Tax=Nocardioides sp. LHG3406-4 TaxID=2804575 RepID=UPI003CE9BD33
MPVLLAALMAALLLAPSASAAGPWRDAPSSSRPSQAQQTGPAAEQDPQLRAAAPKHKKTLRGWQLNERKVGLAPFGLSCDSLKEYTGPARPPAGTKIKRRLVTEPLDLSNGDIVVTKSCIRPTSTGYHNEFLVTTTRCDDSCSAPARGHVVIRDSEISGLAMDPEEISTSCAFLGIGTLKRNLMHGMGSGICFFETGDKFDALAENNYVTGLRSYGDSHNEAATIRDFEKAGGRSATFLNNRLECTSGNVTGGLFIQPTWESIYNVDVIGNYIEGDGYNLFVSGGGGSYDDLSSINNRFRSTGWGPSVVDEGDGWDTWRKNYLFDPSAKKSAGRPVRQ